MKPPKYPLQTVLEQRQRELERAQKRLADALQRVEEERQRLREMETVYRQMEDELREQQAHMYDPDDQGMISPMMIEQRKMAIRCLRERMQSHLRAMEQQQQRVAEAETQVAHAQSALIEADRALRVIEKHHAKWLATWKREMLKKEQQLAEEIASARYVRERMEEE